MQPSLVFWQRGVTAIKGYLHSGSSDKAVIDCFAADMQRFTRVKHTAFKDAFMVNSPRQMHHVVYRTDKRRCQVSIIKI